MLPFSREQSIDVFAQYIAAIWPVQAAAALFGVAIVVALWRRTGLAATSLLWRRRPMRAAAAAA
ncbi:MAG: hypothetical protein KIT60_31050 [Burkholderiaceae bacterium]|nr:hypothetical protein [Burkholderiaceae bacterium]